jgi:hypothetical protein
VTDQGVSEMMGATVCGRFAGRILRTVFPEPEKTVGDAVSAEEKDQTKAAVQIENAEKLVGDRLDHPLDQVVMEKRRNIHERLASVEGRALQDGRRQTGT